MQPTREGLHVAIIMDGNGRWAQARRLPRTAGHRAGARAVDRVIRAAPGLGVASLTLFAFSADNWKRPPEEVQALLRLLGEYLASKTSECVRNGVRLRVIGRRDRLPAKLVEAIAESEAATREGTRLLLRLAIDYSSREAILGAAKALDRSACANDGREAFAQLIAREEAGGFGPPDIDLLIRSGGQQRLSDFLLWECAWAEIVFTPRMWPEFDGEALRAAIDEFRSRQRNFGDIPCSDAG